ncbi:hypothetical protein ANN_07663 [Periplaneta americana]|uniref:Condensin complex subunit 1 n=1 Tax=Periplaneta americana TaxID=6978 RepID=A0ABQ8SZ81_PERAM|nr:hypothetical protein ANN_07663 [Periplaneta americana]
MLKLFDHLVSPLAQGVVQLVREFGCRTIVRELVREIGDMDSSDLMQDTSGTKSFAQFLVEVAESVPELIVPAIDTLTVHLDGESPAMRMCVLGIMGEIVLRMLSVENLDEKSRDMRDQFLDNLEDHLHDVNAFVRVKVIQIWQRLCREKSIPLSRQSQVLKLVVGRLQDKSSNVKKNAIHLVTTFLEGNPFAAKLTLQELQSQLQAEKATLETLKGKSGSEEERRKHLTEHGRQKAWLEREAEIIKVIEDVLKQENTEILLEARKEIGLKVNPEKTKDMVMSRDGNIVRNGNIKIGNLSFEEVEKFKYLGATVTNEGSRGKRVNTFFPDPSNINDTREEIKHRINMGNACYYLVEKLLSSSLLSKNLKVRIYKTVILPVVLYGCETWTLTLREELRLRVFENKVLRKIFGAKRDEVTGEWRKLHNTELHALYSSPDIIRNIKSRRLRSLRWAGHVARMGESRNAYRVLVGRPEGKRPLGRPRRRWEDNIKMDLREVGYDDRDWINLAQGRDQWRAYVRAAMNLWVP